MGWRSYGVDRRQMHCRVCCGAVGAGRRPDRIRRAALVGIALVCGVCPTGTAQALPVEACPNAAARQGPSASLPECRAYEQVTPVDKGDAVDLFPPLEVESTFGAEPIPIDRGYVAEDGDAFLLRATASFGVSAATVSASYVFSRGAGGWGMNVLVPPTPQLQGVAPEVFDPVDLSSVGFRDHVGSEADLEVDLSAYHAAWMVGPVGGPYATVFSASGAAAVLLEDVVYLAGGSENLSEVILESENHQLISGGAAEDQVAGSNALYESNGGGECSFRQSSCVLVNVNSEGLLLSACGASLGQGGDHNASGTAHSAVSSDGSKVFFTAPDPEAHGGPGCWNPTTTPQEDPPELYVRLREANGSMKTVEVSAPEPEMVGVDPDGLQSAAFVGASADGSKVFFITKTELTKDDKGHAPELYEYETETGKLTRISHGESGAAEGDVDFVGAVSSDGSTVYFTAYGDLAPGAAALTPEHGNYFAPVNLYGYDTSTGEVTFITTVNADDYPLNRRKAATGPTKRLAERRKATRNSWV